MLHTNLDPPPLQINLDTFNQFRFKTLLQKSRLQWANTKASSNMDYSCKACVCVRASPPCRVKGSWQALWRGLAKNMPHPSPILLFKQPRLFKLPAPLTILAIERCSLLRPNSGFFLASPTCVKATWNIHDTFSIWRAKKQLTVGECRGKKIGCKLGALQRAFREPAFMRQGGDALSGQTMATISILQPQRESIEWEIFKYKSQDTPLSHAI